MYCIENMNTNVILGCNGSQKHHVKWPLTFGIKMPLTKPFLQDVFTYTSCKRQKNSPAKS